MELAQLSKSGGSQMAILEAGCGVGNFMFPLIEDFNSSSSKDQGRFLLDSKYCLTFRK